MRYTITNNIPEAWEIVEDENGEFPTLKAAKNELIEICKAQIEAEKLMIKQVKEYKKTI